MGIQQSQESWAKKCQEETLKTREVDTNYLIHI